MKKLKLLQRDLEGVANRFPKLRFRKGPEPELGILEGDLDICDAVGEYWDTFKLAIVIPASYPFCVPTVIETSEKIPREVDRHISKDGVCCLDIDHRLLLLGRRGVQLPEFIANAVYPYFANQLYYRENGSYAGGEYAHYFEGIQQYYAESLGFNDPSAALHFLQLILANRLPGRNERCPCGSQVKYKCCHRTSVALLQLLGKERLIQDEEGFRTLLAEPV